MELRDMEMGEMKGKTEKRKEQVRLQRLVALACQAVDKFHPMPSKKAVRSSFPFLLISE